MIFPGQFGGIVWNLQHERTSDRLLSYQFHSTVIRLIDFINILLEHLLKIV